MLWLWCNGKSVPEEISMRMVNFEQHIEHCTHRLDLTIVSAEGLPNVDRRGKSDPYVRVFFDDGTNGEKELGETDVLTDTLNPVWGLPFPALSMEAAEHLGWSGIIRLVVLDHDKLSTDREVCEAVIQVTGKRQPFPLSKMLGEQTLPLANIISAGKGMGKPGGSITVLIAEHKMEADIEQEIHGEAMSPADELRVAKKAARGKRKQAKLDAVKQAKEGKKNERKAKRKAKLEKQKAKMDQKMAKLDGVEDEAEEGGGAEPEAEDGLDLEGRVQGGRAKRGIGGLMHARQMQSVTARRSYAVWDSSDEEGTAGSGCETTEEEEAAEEEQQQEHQQQQEQQQQQQQLYQLGLGDRVQGGGGGKKKSSKSVGVADSGEVVIDVDGEEVPAAANRFANLTPMADGDLAPAETLDDALAMEVRSLSPFGPPLLMN